MIEAPELLRILDALAGKEVSTGRKDKKTGDPDRVKLDANPVLRAMFLVGVNCGFTNKDVADLPEAAVNLKTGWVTFPRPKTGVPRRCKLWRETVDALVAALAVRPEPKMEEARGLVFVTTRGRPWIVRGQANPVSVAARDVMKAVNVHRPGIGFATLRHVFRTVADSARDVVAVNHIMGHVDPSMGAVYRERIDDRRLEAVVAVVHDWLFGLEKQG
jgi:integrase